MFFAEAPGRVFGERVAVALPVGGAHEGRDDLDVPVVDLSRLAPEIGDPEVDVEFEQVDAARALWHGKSVGQRSDNIGSASVGRVGVLHFGPARVPSRESPEAAIALLENRGYTACEIDFEGKFWMDYPWAERFGQLAREAGIVLSVDAPIAGFMGHDERDK